MDHLQNQTTRLRKNLGWIAMMLRSDCDAATNYDLWGAPDHLRTAANIPTVNMGYWKDVHFEQPDSIKLATDALFHLVDETAELGPKDQGVLDAGCGFGTHAIYAQQTFGLQKIVGLNLSSFQLRWCRRLSREARLTDRLSFQQGSATAMPFADASFDKVVCIEAAFHFQQRTDFFHEAFRVLRPGGVLAIADILVVPPKNRKQRLNLGLLRRSLQIPAENVYGAERYQHEIEEPGFVVESAASIREHVVPHYMKWAARNTLHALREVSAAQMLSTMTFGVYPWDYFLFKARKPCP